MNLERHEQAKRSLNVLVMGGTNFIGPRIVSALASRGHAVTLFNRGLTQTDLPSSVERLIGDRNESLDALSGRSWDAAIDVSAYAPAWVRDLGRALRDKVAHYTFISTNAVYADFATDALTSEAQPVLSYDSPDDPYSLSGPRDLREYGALKVLCEREASAHFPGRTLILRPGWVFGPGNLKAPSVYWPARMKHGGPILVAGQSDTPVQFVDVRDLAEWCVRLVEDGTHGTFNVVGPDRGARLSDLIEAAAAAAGSAGDLTYVPAPWLTSRDEAGVFDNILFWTLEPKGFARMMQMDISRALDAGFATRPLATTLKDIFEDFCNQDAERQSLLFPETVRTLEPGDGDMGRLWERYLRLERQMVSEWNAVSASPANG